MPLSKLYPNTQMLPIQLDICVWLREVECRPLGGLPGHLNLPGVIPG